MERSMASCYHPGPPLECVIQCHWGSGSCRAERDQHRCSESHRKPGCGKTGHTRTARWCGSTWRQTGSWTNRTCKNKRLHHCYNIFLKTPLMHPADPLLSIWRGWGQIDAQKKSFYVSPSKSPEILLYGVHYFFSWLPFSQGIRQKRALERLRERERERKCFYVRRCFHCNFPFLVQPFFPLSPPFHMQIAGAINIAKGLK